MTLQAVDFIKFLLKKEMKALTSKATSFSLNKLPLPMYIKSLKGNHSNPNHHFSYPIRKKKTVLVGVLLTFLILFSYVIMSGSSTSTITIVNAQAATITYGVNVSGDQVTYQDRRFLAGLQGSGAKIVRIDLKYDARSDDYQLALMLHNAGFRIIGTLGKRSTPWVDGDFRPVMNVADWQSISQHVLSQYVGIIDYVEVWNEPDLPVFASGYMDGTPAHYMDLLRATVKVATPLGFTKDKLIGPSIAVMRNSSNTPGDFYGAYFAEETVKEGIEQYICADNIHIYDWFLNGFEGLNNAADVYNRAKNIYTLPVWVTEIATNKVSDSEVATKMNQWFKELQIVNCPVVIWYGFIEDYDTNGLLGADFTPKSQYNIYLVFSESFSLQSLTLASRREILREFLVS